MTGYIRPHDELAFCCDKEEADVGSGVGVMKIGLATSVAGNVLDRAQQPRVPRIVRIGLDGLASAAAIMLAAYAAWSRPDVWNLPLIWPDVAIAWFVLVAGKQWLLRRRNRTSAEELRFSVLWVGAIYAAAMTYLLLARAYYSRSFLLTSLLALLLWQTIDALLIGSNKRTLKLAGIPSPAVERLKDLRGVELITLQRPKIEENVDGLVLDMHQPLSPEWARFVAEWAATGRAIFHSAAVYESATSRVPLEYLSDGWVGELFSGSIPYLHVKRALDLSIVFLTLPITVPLSLIIAAAIWIDTGRPVLFWQVRVGQHGRPFMMAKFRSMQVDAEADGAQFASRNDERVTRVGRLIRKLRLDELPQLWNVLRGEMSLIGPRPEQAIFVHEFSRRIPFYSWRHRVKPGITGWAQVQHGYASGLEDTMIKLEYDLYYVKHLSFWLDLTIAVKTVWIMLTGWGAR